MIHETVSHRSRPECSFVVKTWWIWLALVGPSLARVLNEGLISEQEFVFLCYHHNSFHQKHATEMSEENKQAAQQEPEDEEFDDW